MRVAVRALHLAILVLASVPASALAGTQHDVERAAELQAAAFERLTGGEAVDAAVLREVSDAAASVGVAPGSPEASEIARRLSELHDLGG